MITLYDIIIIIVIVLIIAPLILAIIITSRRPKFGRFDNVSSRRKFGSGVDEDAEIRKLDQTAFNIDENIEADIIPPQILTNALTYIGKSRHLIPKLKKELDEYRKHGVMPISEHEVIPISDHEVIPISEHESRIASKEARHREYKETYGRIFQERLDASNDKIEELTSELERLRVLLSTNNAELERLRSLNDKKNQQSDNMQPSGNTKEIKQYTDKIKELREKRNRILDRNDELNDINNTLEENNASLQTSLETLEQENRKIHAEIENFTQQIGEITAQNKRLQQTINEKNHEISQLKTHNISVSHNRNEESYDYGHSLADELGNNFDPVEDTNLENAVREEFENNNSENAKLKETIQSQLEQLEQLTRDINSLRSENEELKRLNLELQAKLTAESAKVANLEQQNKALEQEIEQCRNTKDQVGSDSNSRLYELIKENTVLVNELESSINDTPPPNE